MEYKIETMKSSDWKEIKSIYLEGIKTGLATFQTEVRTEIVRFTTNLCKVPVTFQKLEMNFQFLLLITVASLFSLLLPPWLSGII